MYLLLIYNFYAHSSTPYNPLSTTNLQEYIHVVPKLPHPLTIAENFPSSATQEVNEVNCRKRHMMANHMQAKMQTVTLCFWLGRSLKSGQGTQEMGM
jgi:hypothetical protein